MKKLLLTIFILVQLGFAQNAENVKWEKGVSESDTTVKTMNKQNLYRYSKENKVDTQNLFRYSKKKAQKPKSQLVHISGILIGSVIAGTFLVLIAIFYQGIISRARG